MWSKLYLALLVIAIAVMAFFTFYSWSWLHSIGKPMDAIDGYMFHLNISSILLWLSSAVLILLANVILWKTRHSWAVWASGLYFSVFTIARYFWLDQSYLDFSKTAGLSNSSFSAGPLFAVMLILLCGVLVFCDQYAVVRLQRTMYPPIIEAEAEPPKKSEE